VCVTDWHILVNNFIEETIECISEDIWGRPTSLHCCIHKYIQKLWALKNILDLFPGDQKLPGYVVYNMWEWVLGSFSKLYRRTQEIWLPYIVLGQGAAKEPNVQLYCVSVGHVLLLADKKRCAFFFCVVCAVSSDTLWTYRSYMFCKWSVVLFLDTLPHRTRLWASEYRRSFSGSLMYGLLFSRPIILGQFSLTIIWAHVILQILVHL
jgi:hypothetical protein